MRHPASVESVASAIYVDCSEAPVVKTEKLDESMKIIINLRFYDVR